VPILKAGEVDIISHSADQTRRLGMRLGKLLQPDDVICLSGDMGAGKTVFAAGVGAGWGSKLRLTSPTFNLVHEHTREADSQRLYHLDCYRLNGLQEAASIGLDDILDAGGVVLLEWPENIADALPAERVWVELRVLEQTRRNLILEGSGQRALDLLARFRASTFGV